MLFGMMIKSSIWSCLPSGSIFIESDLELPMRFFTWSKRGCGFSSFVSVFSAEIGGVAPDSVTDEELESVVKLFVVNVEGMVGVAVVTAAIKSLFSSFLISSLFSKLRGVASGIGGVTSGSDF